MHPNQLFIVFVALLVLKPVGGNSLLDKLNAIGPAKKFEKPEDAAKFITALINISVEIGCAVHKAFFKGI